MNDCVVKELKFKIGLGNYYGNILHYVTTWTLPDTINSNWLDKRDKRIYSVTGNCFCLYFRKYILM